MMIEHPLIEEMRRSFHYDPGTGAICRKPSKKNACVYTGSRGYKIIAFKRRKFLAHRVAWAIYYGVWPSDQIDHINGSRTDNRIANLRDVDSGINAQNLRAALCTNKVGTLGVHATYKSGSIQYRARIKVPSGPQIYLGSFGTAEEASAAYLQAKRLLHPGCTL